MVGATLVLALNRLGFRTLLVEAKPFSDKIVPDFDARSLALAPASVRILADLGLWSLLQADATAIDTIHISQQGHFGQTCLQRDDEHPLGYVVEVQHIHRALHSLLKKQRLIAPAQIKTLDADSGSVVVTTAQGEEHFTANVIVAADGSDSFVRRLCELPFRAKAYGQQALVTNVGLVRSHQGEAYERFIASGPLALLPLSGLRASLVWSLWPEDAARLLICSERDFLKELQTTFGYRLGRFVKVGRRVVYPLQSAVMPQQVKGRVVFIGNAAHTLHPVAGQGFNLGLRDVAMLAQCMANADKELTPSVLSLYEKARCNDQRMAAIFTDGLVRLFTSRFPGLSFMRSAGLVALDNMSLLKNNVIHYARGFAGVPPDLVCGIPLKRRE